jgi:Zn-dependent membrane protease YugP
MYMGYFILTGVLSLIGMVVQNTLKRKFRHYGQIPVSNRMSGAEVAHAMLSYYGLDDVKVTQGDGFLTDHYNPQTRTVTLSPVVFQGQSIASSAVAAHECGHAVQHAEAYAFLQFRSAMVPVVKFASAAQQFLLFGALVFFANFPQLLLVVIIAFAATTLFSFITLPVEFDASRRALAWLNETGTSTGAEFEGAKDALKWAAMTYVAAALSSLVVLVWLVLRYLGARN